MVVTLGQQLLLLLLLFLTFSALVANQKKTNLHGGQFRSWSAEQGKKKKKSGSPPPPPPPSHAARSEKNKKYENTKITRRIHMPRRYASRRYAGGLGLSRVRTKDSCDSSARPMGVASQNSTLPCAIATFPVSLPLCSPGDVWPRLPLLPSTRP